MNRMLEDSELIRRCQAGQLEYIDVLVDRYESSLYTMCRKLTGDPSDADELFQETWVRVLRSIGRVSPEKRFLNWLLAICVNRYRDRYRMQKRWQKKMVECSVSEDLGPDPANVQSDDAGPYERLAYKELVAAVRTALDKLDDRHRIPLLLHYFQQLSLAEIAEILDIPTGTVKTRLASARQKLKPLIEVTLHE